jgi:hypothetical protein
MSRELGTPGGQQPQAIDRLTETTEALAALVGTARSDGLDATAALASLTTVRRLAADLEHGELALIEAARGSGATWAQIAGAMGASNRQTAQKRHADLARRIYRPPAVDIMWPGKPQPAAAQDERPGQGTAKLIPITPASAETEAPAARARTADTGSTRQAAPRITPKIIREGLYELVKAPDHAESRTWHVLVDGNHAGLVRPTWRGERSRQGWEAVDNAGTALPATGTGMVTVGGHARTRDAAAVSLLHALQRQQEAERRRRRTP